MLKNKAQIAQASTHTHTQKTKNMSFQGPKVTTVGEGELNGRLCQGGDRCPRQGREATEWGGGGEDVGEGIPPSHGRDLFKN